MAPAASASSRAARATEACVSGYVSRFGLDGTVLAARPREAARRLYARSSRPVRGGRDVCLVSFFFWGFIFLFAPTPDWAAAGPRAGQHVIPGVVALDAPWTGIGRVVLGCARLVFAAGISLAEPPPTFYYFFVFFSRDVGTRTWFFLSMVLYRLLRVFISPAAAAVINGSAPLSTGPNVLPAPTGSSSTPPDPLTIFILPPLNHPSSTPRLRSG
jgi:hypothetical protein